MNVLNLVSSVSNINFGVWNVVISILPSLEKYGCSLTVCFPASDEKIPDQIKVLRFIQINKNLSEVIKIFPAENSIVISHGNWAQPTKWAYHLKTQGYKWIAVPHGMLEPWSMNHKKWKKKIYFTLYERKMLSRADAIVAVGGPEYDNLKKIFGEKVVHIPNGIDPYKGALKKAARTRIFLFMGRLHHKKGVLPLAQAWLRSRLGSDPNVELWIAGPDEGELGKIKAEIERHSAGLPADMARGRAHGEIDIELRNKEHQLRSSVFGLPTSTSNLQLLGPLYGQQKEEILRQAHFFVLPSQSEGFPTSIIESMTYSCVPIITEGCNFPEAIESKVAIPTDFDVEKIMQSLEFAAAMKEGEFSERSGTAKNFADSHYNLERIAELQFKLYESVLKS